MRRLEGFDQPKKIVTAVDYDGFFAQLLRQVWDQLLSRNCRRTAGRKDDLGRPHARQAEPQHELVAPADVGLVARAEQRPVGLRVRQHRAGHLPWSFPYNGGLSRSELSRLCSSSTSDASASPWRTHHLRKPQSGLRTYR